MYVNKETDHDVWKFMMYVDDGFMMDVDTSCMKSMDLYMMYPPSWIHRRHTLCNQLWYMTATCQYKFTNAATERCIGYFECWNDLVVGF